MRLLFRRKERKRNNKKSLGNDPSPLRIKERKASRGIREEAKKKKRGGRGK